MTVGQFSVRIGAALLAGLMVGCGAAPPKAEAPVASPSASPASLSPAATIAEIQRSPVFVRLRQTPQEQPAQKGMGLQIGDTIRTQDQAMAQLDLSNGLAFRIGGDAVLTLQPDNRLNLAAGSMITWVQPGQKVPTEIVTPIGVAGIRGTTVHVEIPKDPNQGTRFFAWEGLVSVRLPGQTEEIQLRTAEEVRIKPSDRDLNTVRQRIRRIPLTEWRQKRQSDQLLNGFRGRITTQTIIDRIKPGQVTLSDPVPTPPAVPRPQPVAPTPRASQPSPTPAASPTPVASPKPPAPQPANPVKPQAASQPPRDRTAGKAPKLKPPEKQRDREKPRGRGERDDDDRKPRGNQGDGRKPRGRSNQGDDDRKPRGGSNQDDDRKPRNYGDDKDDDNRSRGSRGGKRDDDD
ncbi:FecR domain-containing protein [Leptolyngbya sp. FACHB-36]|uniref:FecR domain-containing protein n=1 Tax=Leptolyngbya sp. FACHB-36 TaxID=2692808 RepID=UPI0016818545|nr:FecR domain-containing protein [Leptolyngbya sp. FACHB-36]MBD2020521.1 FecR domain-containing protein [Leptolyngbya sp. FACHB-36]